MENCARTVFCNVPLDDTTGASVTAFFANTLSILFVSVTICVEPTAPLGSGGAKLGNSSKVVAKKLDQIVCVETLLISSNATLLSAALSGGFGVSFSTLCFLSSSLNFFTSSSRNSSDSSNVCSGFLFAF